MTTELLFEYSCPECGRGTVKTTRVHNYKTKIRGYPFVVDDALIGVCDQCQAESFAPEETNRWEELFSHSLEARQAFLSPEEIAELRKSLGLSMEDFARLIGSTRQSISMWEKADRTSPPIRTADLLMKLVRQSLQSGPVDVLTLLLEEAKKWGVIIEVRRPSFVPLAKKVPRLSVKSRDRNARRQS
jgi:putative zinc finger/helix-turn-helix YgiT family protein